MYAQVLGVEPYFCPSLSAALEAGKPVHADTTATLADGLAVPTVSFNYGSQTKQIFVSFFFVFVHLRF